MNVYWYALAGAILFFALSPGVLLTIPNSKDCSVMIPIIRGKKECATSFAAVAVHSLVFGAAMAIFILIAQYKF
jgi:hypothetical protein